MHKHRVARLIAGLLFIASLLFFLIAVAAGYFVASNQSPVGNWGPGWQSWILVPTVISAFFSSVALLVLGAVIFFMAQIETNLFLTRHNRANAMQHSGVSVAKAPAAPGAVVTPSTLAVPLATEPATDEAVTPSEPAGPSSPTWTAETEAATPADVAPQGDSGPVESPPDATSQSEQDNINSGISPSAIAAETAAAAAATVAVAEAATEPPTTSEPVVIVEPLSEIDMPVVDPPAFDGDPTTAGTTQAPRVEIANLDPDIPDDELPGFVDDEPMQPFTGRLPGSDEAARIASEMASMQPPDLDGGDDLLLVQGIGPIYAQRLRAAGIATYAELASASDELLEELTDGNLERVVREDWRGQARQLSR